MHSRLDELLTRWPSATAFYAERDHRTQLEVNEIHSYAHMPVEIHIDQELASDVTLQRITLLAANLTARWARNVRVFVPHTELAPELRICGDRHLDVRVRREMEEADPFGEFHVGNLVSSRSSLRLFVGSSTHLSLTENDYVVDATGWTALGSRGGSQSKYDRQKAAAPVAALAAAIGSGDLFKRAVGHPQTEWLRQVIWSTWDHRLTDNPSVNDPVVPEFADLGNLLLAGVGAIGSALLYILGLMPLGGRVTILDRDRVETSNLNRSPLFTATDVLLSRNKTDIASDFLRSCGIQTQVLQGTWRQHCQDIGSTVFDVWVSLTNEDGAWAEVPFQLPPVVLHGTTTSGWGIGFGRHVPRVEDCTACRLPRPHAEFRGPCAEGEITKSDNFESVRASLPFLSSASAALIAVELLKLHLAGASRLPNSVQADFRVGLPAVIAALIGSNKHCQGCQISHLPLWMERGGQSRFASWSERSV
jgi:hypothetical protein